MKKVIKNLKTMEKYAHKKILFYETNNKIKSEHRKYYLRYWYGYYYATQESIKIIKEYQKEYRDKIEVMVKQPIPLILPKFFKSF